MDQIELKTKMSMLWNRLNALPRIPGRDPLLTALKKHRHFLQRYKTEPRLHGLILKDVLAKYEILLAAYQLKFQYADAEIESLKDFSQWNEKGVMDNASATIPTPQI